ncbi:MAG: hypothetical protein AMS24_04755 [Chlamydiae bacterium SM23_39]|nr:MAG: hypothetical protein AMS24_04755 [Chlamydiae bacterium SM23_39]
METFCLKKNNLPHHIAIIMDGNRRWAKKNNLEYIEGYKKGAANLKNILKAAININIKILTVYAFSTENWNRSNKEIDSLMDLFETYLNKYLNSLKKENIKIRTIGDISKCSKRLQLTIEKAKIKTKNCNKIELVLAINYGGRNEIKRAMLKIIDDLKNKKISKKNIDEKLISDYLDTYFCKDPDLLIRTSGENRISNFLLWQSSYSEFYTTQTLWPDFTKNHFFDAISYYQSKKRRFGRI